MIELAEMLAREGFASIGWAPQSDGKAPTRAWKADATDDPALVPGLLHGACNSLVIPKGRAIVVDIDQPEVWAELEAAGLPATLTVNSPTPGHGHVYGWVPPSVDMGVIPGSFAGGEIRRHNPATDTASMVLGPWSLRTDGVYTPRPDAQSIATLPRSVIDYLIASKRHQDAKRSAARGPRDAGWKITNGRHDYLISRGRWLRGNAISGERLVEELLRLDCDRCDPPLADVAGRGSAEVRRIAAWCDATIQDDPPRVTLDLSPEPPVTSGRNLSERFASPAELLATLPATTAFVWSRFVACGAVHELDGAAKSAGKSTFLGYLMSAVLDGRPFLGQPTMAGPIVFLTEQPTASLRALLERTGLSTRTDLRVLRWRDTRGSAWLEIVAAAVAECDRIGARLLVVDTLPQFAGLRGDAENDAGSALLAIEPLQVAAAGGLAVIVVRHTRKAGGEVGESGRGSSAFAGAVDVILQLARQANPVRPTIRVLSTLSRFDETPPEIVVELTDEGYVLLGDQAAVAFVEARREVLAAVSRAPDGLTEAEIADGTSGRKSTVGEALRSLVMSSEIVRKGAGKRGQPYRYARPSSDSGFVSPALRDRAVGESNSSPDADSIVEPVDLWAEAQRIFGDDLIRVSA